MFRAVLVQSRNTALQLSRNLRTSNNHSRYRTNDQKSEYGNNNSRWYKKSVYAFIPFAGLFAFAQETEWEVNGQAPNYVQKVRAHEKEIRQLIADLIDGDDYDGHGSYGPVFVRLAWHASGTYDKTTGTGGSNGANMRFEEGTYGANNGLNLARERLEEVRKKFPFMSYADIWTLAAVVAIEEMGGPLIPWRPGRSDSTLEKHYIVPDDRLPDGALGSDHVRHIFYRMGFNDQEITALIGAHALGKCHADRSGFDGPWTRSPTTFSNTFYQVLLDEKWAPRKWNGPHQYENQNGKDLMMLPADMAFLVDPAFRIYVEKYAKDEELFFKDFTKVFSKLLELGVPFPESK